jgi:RTX calcium-binding nonapeptide repeat (4 copies)
MFNYLQRLTVLTTAIFLSCVLLFQFSPLTSPYYSVVYAAVISCGPASDPRWNPCLGTEGDDNMRGDSEYNIMGGLEGNDQLSGGAVDILHGGYGNDQLSGGPGDDNLEGSFGADSFRCGPGNDQIVYFNASQGDTKSNDCERLWP